MFARNINYQFHTYVSYKSDPKAKAVDSFTDIVVCHLAGSSQKAIEFQRKLKTYWKHHGDRQQGKNMLGICCDSHSIVINGMLIPFRQPPK